MIKYTIYNNKINIAFTIVLICLCVVIYALIDFIQFKRHDGLPSLLVGICSYSTTTLAILITMMFHLDM